MGLLVDGETILYSLDIYIFDINDRYPKCNHCTACRSFYHIRKRYHPLFTKLRIACTKRVAIIDTAIGTKILRFIKNFSSSNFNSK